MAYTSDFSISLGSSKAGLTLNAQIVDSAGANVGAAITTGFVEIGGGCYLLSASVPDDQQGGIKFYESGVPGTILAFCAINPSEQDQGNQLDALMAKAVTLPTAAPTAPYTLDKIFGFLLAVLKFKRDQTASLETLYQDDGSTSLATAAKNDNGTTFTRSEYS